MQNPQHTQQALLVAQHESRHLSMHGVEPVSHVLLGNRVQLLDLLSSLISWMVLSTELESMLSSFRGQTVEISTQLFLLITWVEALAPHDKSALTKAKLLVDEIVTCHGNPTIFFFRS